MSDPVDNIIKEIQESSKYRAMNLLDVTLRDIVERELKHHKKSREGVKAARRKIHRVIAPYLGDPDYALAEQAIQAAVQTGEIAQLQTACASILMAHDSTRERLEIAQDFYPKIFEVTGKPSVLLDVACGLNPLFFPWMGLEALTLYAYDIHEQRVNFLNAYLGQQPGLTGVAIRQDILVEPPTQTGDVAIILKEIHRFEDRRHNCTLPLLEALQAHWIVISLPPHNLTGRRDLRDFHRGLFYSIVEGKPWRVVELDFDNEMVFCIEK